MKKTILFSMFAMNLFAKTTLLYPNEMQIEELNKDVETKLQTIEKKNSNYISLPNQYKGKLRYTESEQITKFRDYKLTFGFGMYFLNKVSNISIENIEKENWKLKSNFNFDISIGAYWINGVKVEYEYGSLNSKVENKNDLTLNTKKNTINVVLEQSFVKSKWRPYIGVGLGIANFEFKGNKNSKKGTTAVGQVVVGLSYPLNVDERLIIYLGYKGLFAPKIKQEIYGKEQSYKFAMHTLEFKTRFMF
jgi:hypothetical protein